jgi:hypothetical protein
VRYCTRCGVEYREWVVRCPDCGEELVAEAEWKVLEGAETERREQLRDVDMRCACTVGGRIEAERLIAALDQEGIPAFVRTFEEVAFDGLFLGQKGWGEIWVARNRLDEARELVEALRAAPDEPDDAGDAGEGRDEDEEAGPAGVSS